MKTLSFKEEKPPKKDEASDMIYKFLLKNKGKPYSLNQICIHTGVNSGGHVSARIKRMVNEDIIKSVNCPCGQCMMYYHGKKPKI